VLTTGPGAWRAGVLALALAIVGTAVAGSDGLTTNKVTKSKVKSIAKKQADKQLKANVAGSHVNTAVNATNATNAQNAITAQNVGGVEAKAFSTESLVTADDIPVVNAGGLVLTMNCGAGVNVDATAATETNNARISSTFTSETLEADGSNETIFNVDKDFDVANAFSATPAGLDEGETALTYRAANGTTLSAVFRTSQGGAQGCIVEGTLTYGFRRNGAWLRSTVHRAT
jgi:hypothetical protein